MLGQLKCSAVFLLVMLTSGWLYPTDPPPNVLFIAVDDLRPEMEAYGAKPKTPNLNRLAQSGTRFDRAYCQQAVCGASRLSIMGGLYPTYTLEQTFHVEGWRNRHPDLLTLNQHFVSNGYQTVGLGKIYHGTQGPGVDPKNWTRWVKLQSPMYLEPENIKLERAFKEAGTVGDQRDPPKGPTTECGNVDDEAYIDGKRARSAVKVLKQLAESDRPFFLAVGFTKPHLPFNAPKKYWDLYDRRDFEMPSNSGLPPGYPKYAANLPAWEMKKYSDYVGELPTDFPDDMNRRLLHGYAACVSYMDANVGLLLDELENLNLVENTIVVFWGDHGWKLGDHSTWCKHTNLECDTRVPLMIRVPGYPSNTTQREVELIDLYPTLCELTGIEIPGHVQGKSLKDLLLNPKALHRECAYSSYPAGKKEIGHSIRMGDYRYTEWRSRNGKPSPRKKHVLTNLKADPGEVTNVVNEPEYADVLTRAETLLNSRVTAAHKN